MAVTERHLVPLGGLSRKPAGTTADRYVQIALLGGVDLDLSAASLPAGGTTVTKVSLIGGVSVVAPPGVRIATGGLSILGRRKIETGPAADGARVLRIRNFGLIGGTKVRAAPPEQD